MCNKIGAFKEVISKPEDVSCPNCDSELHDIQESIKNVVKCVISIRMIAWNSTGLRSQVRVHLLMKFQNGMPSS